MATQRTYDIAATINALDKLCEKLSAHAVMDNVVNLRNTLQAHTETLDAITQINTTITSLRKHRKTLQTQLDKTECEFNRESFARYCDNSWCLMKFKIWHSKESKWVVCSHRQARRYAQGGRMIGPICNEVLFDRVSKNLTTAEIDTRIRKYREDEWHLVVTDPGGKILERIRIRSGV